MPFAWATLTTEQWGTMTAVEWSAMTLDPTAAAGWTGVNVAGGVYLLSRAGQGVECVTAASTFDPIEGG